MGIGVYMFFSTQTYMKFTQKATQPTWMCYTDVHCKIVQFCHWKHIKNKTNNIDVIVRNKVVLKNTLQYIKLCICMP